MVVKTVTEHPRTWYGWLNEIHPVWLIWGMLCLQFLSFVPSVNDEQYILCARQHYNPDWIPGSFSANEFPGTRFLFEWIMGWFVDWVGFEAGVFWGRFFNFLLLAFPVAGLFRMLKFNNLEIFILFEFYLFSSQHYYAGEWIFKASEAKTFAYIFVFWGLIEFLKARYYRAFGLIVAASFFHVLVGGWFAASCFGALALKRENWEKIPVLGALYALPLLPFIYYLSRHMFNDLPEAAGNVNLDHIYVYFRNRHHLGLFYEWGYFLKKHAFGVSLAIGAFWWFVRHPFPAADIHFERLRQLLLVMLGTGFLFLGVSLADKLFFDLSGGFLLKCYPWRMQGLAWFITFILVARQLQNANQNPGGIFNLSVGFSRWLPLLAFVFLSIKTVANIGQMVTYQNDEHYNEVIEFFKKNTPKPSLVLILGNAEVYQNGQGHLREIGVDFMRRTERDNFVVYKLVPAGNPKRYEWYKRLQIAIAVEKHPARFGELTRDYKIDYVLSPKNIRLTLPVVFENEAFTVYKNDPSNKILAPAEAKQNPARPID